MTACRETFKVYIEGGDLDYDELSTKHPDFCCELESCSEHSPRTVSHGEVVSYLLTSEYQYDPVRKQLLPDGFLELLKRDLSVIRNEFATKKEVSETREELIDLWSKKTPPKPRVIDKICMAPVKKLRDLEVDGVRALGLYDTAFQDRRCHASIVMDRRLGEKLKRKRARDEMLQILKEKIDNYEGFFNSLPEK